MLRVISYNIRYNNVHDGENAWPYRKERVAELLRRHLPDLIGLQEVKKDQLDDLILQLPDFGWIGIGRDDGKIKGEFAAIFYRRARLSMVDSGSIWLSETPHIIGSVGWDASMARIATWAEFAHREQESQQPNRFLHVNTHFDHRGQTAQFESARLLRRFLAAREYSLPSIVTGDFNCIETSLPYDALTAPDKSSTRPLLDAMYCTTTHHQGPLETFNTNFTNPLQAKIDYIFVQPMQQKEAALQVHSHAILNDNQAGCYPSDHLPVMADILF